MINALDHRKADHPIEKLFLARWSPRAMTGEPLKDNEIASLFEAGRWAPSTYNEQEWRFLYARRDTPHWQTFFELLAAGLTIMRLPAVAHVPIARVPRAKV